MYSKIKTALGILRSKFFEDLMDAMLCNHSSKIREIYLMKKPSKLAIFFEL